MKQSLSTQSEQPVVVSQPSAVLAAKATRTARRPAPAGPKFVWVDAESLIIHPMVGLTADELRCRPSYASRIHEELDRLRLKVDVLYQPTVMPVGDKFGAFANLPTAIAAMTHAQDFPRCAVRVLQVASYSGREFLADQIDPVLNKTIWEQASALEAKRIEHGSLRKWMESEELDPKKWDSKCSKLAKIRRLDETILSKIDPFSLTSVNAACNVVDAWRDDAARIAMTAVLAEAGSDTNRRIKANSLLRSMLNSTTAEKPRARWTQQTDGDRMLIDANGRTVARQSMRLEVWMMLGVNGSVFDAKLLSLALEATRADNTELSN